jgi:hypothetical protein
VKNIKWRFGSSGIEVFDFARNYQRVIYEHRKYVSQMNVVLAACGDIVIGKPLQTIPF